MLVKVLGSAAGGGFPQWNCGCSNCSRLRAGLFKGRPRTQTQTAISAYGASWALLNASPDLRQQLLEHREFAPADGSRSTPIAAIILTSADVDCVLGLLHLREFQPLRIYATSSVARILAEENTLFRVLDRSAPAVQWEILPLEKEVCIFEQSGPADSGCVRCRAVPLGGEFPDYVSTELRKRLPGEEAVIALELSQGTKRLFYAPSLPGEATSWKRRMAESQVALLDGTFWSNDEIIDVRGEGKTAREIGHVPLSGAKGLIEELENGLSHVRRVLIHINNTNPILDEESAASHALHRAGLEVAYDGMEFEL